MFPQFEFLGRTIGCYGLCSLIGLVLCVLLAFFLGKRFRYTFADILLLTLSIGGGIFIGGHLLFAVTQLKSIVTVILAVGKAPASLIVRALAECFGGMVYYGGFLGGVVAELIHSKLSKCVNYPHTMDLYTAMVPLFHTFGRIGCFLGGCCYGKEWSWGFAAAENAIVPDMAGPVRIPVQLMEAGMNLLIFGVLLTFFLKRTFEGRLIYTYLLIYPVVRFFLEFLRGDALRGIFWGLSTSQWISLALFVFALIRTVSASQPQSQ